MSIIDIGIIVIIAVSALMSIKRGFIREVLSLVIWLAAFMFAVMLHQSVAPLLESYISVPSLRKAAASLLVFVATLLLGSVISFALGGLIKATGLTSTDRFLGVLFGALRGMIIVTILVMLFQGLMSEDTWWQESKLIPHFDVLKVWLKDAVNVLYNFISTQLESS